MKLFRELSDEESESFRSWARENYLPYSPIDGTWHPIIQAECARINGETEIFAGNRDPESPNLIVDAKRGDDPGRPRNLAEAKALGIWQEVRLKE